MPPREGSRQVCAPAHPLLASNGAVVGVVVSKLNAVKMAADRGDLPQNVNFAVRGDLAKLFMSQNGIAPEVSPDPGALAPEDLAERAKAFTVFIECN